MNDTAPDTMIVPEFIQEATRRFEESPRTYQTDGADALLPPRAAETRPWPVRRSSGMYRNAKIIQIYEGANEIQELVISRAMQRAVQDG